MQCIQEIDKTWDCHITNRFRDCVPENLKNIFSTFARTIARSLENIYMNKFWSMQGVNLPKSLGLLFQNNAYDDINGRCLWRFYTLNQFTAMQGIIIPNFKFNKYRILLYGDLYRLENFKLIY